MLVVHGLDFAGPARGWALGTFWTGWPVTATTVAAAWHYEAGDWSSHAIPEGLNAIVAVRALPDGSAWAATESGKLLAATPDGWRPVAGAPQLAPRRERGTAAPFDVVSTPSGPVGWVGGLDGMYFFAAGRFEKVDTAGQVRVDDLQLVDERHGWAIGNPPPGFPFARDRFLFQLEDRQWRIIPVASLGVRDLDWVGLSAAAQDEAWLLGDARVTGSTEPARILARFDGAWQAFGVPAEPSDELPTCQATGLSAIAGPRRGPSEVWLLGTTGPCGPSGEAAVSGAFAGPISRLRVLPLRDRAYLPLVSTR
jgi:hypothetical protein